MISVMISGDTITVKVASDVLPDQESTDIIRASCIEFMHSKTIWFVRRTRSDVRLAFKVSYKGHTVTGTECCLLHEDVHFINNEFWLPQSYKPYMGHQFWVDLSGGTDCDLCEGEYLSMWGDYRFSLLPALGFELVQGGSGETTHNLNDLALRRCKMAEFELMRSNSIVGEQPTEIVIPDVARPDVPLRKLHVFAGAFHGKTTAMQNGEALDLEANLDDMKSFLEKLGIEITPEQQETTLRWEQSQQHGDDTSLEAWFELEGPDVYGDLVRIWTESDVPVTTSHFSEDSLETVLDSGRAISFVTLDFKDIYSRADNDTSGFPLIRTVAAVGYYMNVAELAPRGPAFSNIGDAVTAWAQGLDKAESCILNTSDTTEDINA
jgi:hypothetical protein